MVSRAPGRPTAGVARMRVGQGGVLAKQTGATSSARAIEAVLKQRVDTGASTCHRPSANRLAIGVAQRQRLRDASAQSQRLNRLSEAYTAHGDLADFSSLLRGWLFESTLQEPVPTGPSSVPAADPRHRRAARPTVSIVREYSTSPRFVSRAGRSRSAAAGAGGASGRDSMNGHG
jgi:hypothetical protein